MDIRPTQQSDLARLAMIWYDRIALLQQSDFYFTPLPDAMQVWEQNANRWIVDEDIGFFVAETDTHLMGYIVVSIVDGPVGLRPKQIGRIVDMGLDLHQSQSGLGGSLIEQAKLWLGQHQIRILTVDLPAYYPVEEAFWRSLGAKLRFNEFWMVI